MTSTLYDRIRDFYDDSSELWEQVWGEHMHHGYYGRAGTYTTERRQAQIELIEALLAWAEIENQTTILDAGCGIGGSTLYLAQKFGARVTGITLSPRQASRAREKANATNLNSVTFQVANALETPFAADTFDLVWSLESGEHMPDKTQFLQECYRVLKPGGKLMLATWCHRPTHSLAGELTADEREHLEEIYRVYCLPHVISLPEYEAIAWQCGFRDLRADDWSAAVAPFWDEVVASAVDVKAAIGLMRAGWKTVEAALSLELMRRGYARGLVRFGVLCGTKSRLM